jgi:23S rRNA (uracil1939-C5)-methyltransferase
MSFTEDPSNAIRNEVRDFANANGLTFFNPRAHEGLLRTLMLRTSSGEIMVLIQFFENDKVNRELILDHLYEKFPYNLFAICGQQ